MYAGTLCGMYEECVDQAAVTGVCKQCGSHSHVIQVPIRRIRGCMCKTDIIEYLICDIVRLQMHICEQMYTYCWPIQASLLCEYLERFA